MKNSKEVTIYDIAKALKLAPSTVSRGLKDHPGINAGTKKKILDKAKELQYQQNIFASNLRKNSTKTIGVVIPRFNSYFMSTVIAGIELVANQSGYNLIINQSQESFEKEISCINTLFHSRVDGYLISHSVETANTGHLKLLQEKKIPVIFFDRMLTNSPYTGVVIDNLQAGYDATDHLIRKGCRRIVHFGGGTKCNLYNDRYLGYKMALENNGIDFDPQLVFHNIFNEENSIHVAKLIMAMKNMPDGLFIANDMAATMIMNYLIRNGIQVPKDIAIIGFNNDPISKLVSPAMSTVNYPGNEMGKIAAFTLINILKGNQQNLNKIVLNFEIIERESTRKS